MQLQVVSVIVVLSSADKFLLVQRALDDEIFPGKWQNVGGKVKLGETLEEAALREVKEEVGLDVRPDFRFVMSYSWQKNPEEPSRLGVILFVQLPDEAITQSPITLDAELCDYGWFSINELEKLDTIGPESPTGTIAQIEKALSKRK